jgi:hypothetical protein
MWPVLLAPKLHQHKDLHIASLQYKNDQLILFVEKFEKNCVCLLLVDMFMFQRHPSVFTLYAIMTNAGNRIRLKNLKENKNTKCTQTCNVNKIEMHNLG